jgi:hypothetical protein
MKIRNVYLVICLILNLIPASTLNSQPKNEAAIKIVNPLNAVRTDVVIEIPFSKFKKLFVKEAPKYISVISGSEELVSQVNDINSDGIPESICAVTYLKAKEQKNIIVKSFREKPIDRKFKQRAHAELYKKVDYKLENGYYTGGRFVPINEIEVPKDHFAHNALFKFEGPGWESDKVAYRFYLDSRNRNDLFGKKVNEIVLPIVGINDLISDSKESYTKMNDWGMDIFKVGESIGLGSVGIWDNNKVNTISMTEKTICKVAMDGPIRAGIRTEYLNTKIGNSIYNLTSLLTIEAGSRLTKVQLESTKNNVTYCTGLPKHADTKFYADNKNYEWGYIAQYGLQSLNKDSLGIAVFYKKKDLVKITEDQFSQLVVLKSTKGNLDYYYAAAWEQELNGIKNESDFMKYLDETILELSNSVRMK